MSLQPGGTIVRLSIRHKVSAFPNHALHPSTAKTLTSLPLCEIITTITFAIAAKGPVLISSIGADDLRLYVYPG
jgi:hypothetical protein